MKLLITVLATGAVVAAAMALPATGQQAPSARTVTLTSLTARGSEHSIDAPPKGESAGDRFIFASTLRRGSAMPGGWRATAWPSTPSSRACSAR